MSNWALLCCSKVLALASAHCSALVIALEQPLDALTWPEMKVNEVDEAAGMICQIALAVHHPPGTRVVLRPTRVECVEPCNRLVSSSICTNAF